jgi:hypothetical protein
LFLYNINNTLNNYKNVYLYIPAEWIIIVEEGSDCHTSHAWLMKVGTESNHVAGTLLARCILPTRKQSQPPEGDFFAL